MTLLEILVRDLPKLGGWPDGAVFVAQEEGGYLWSFTYKPQKDCDDEWMDESHHGYHTEVGKIREASDHNISTITREQYEAALAAVEPEWNGDGLPPVGVNCEIKRIADWMLVTIKFISTNHTVFTTFGGTEDCYQTCSLQFRPIRSEADKKRDESINVIAELCRSSASNGHSAELIYDAISAGKIPHLKIV